jgi:hypothetical protein
MHPIGMKFININVKGYLDKYDTGADLSYFKLQQVDASNSTVHVA